MSVSPPVRVVHRSCWPRKNTRELREKPPLASHQSADGTARVQPGRHRVEIRGSRPLAGKPIISDMPSGVRQDSIPSQFNDASKREAEIPATGPHQLPLDLPAGK